MPLPAAPVEAPDATEAARAPKDRSVEEEVRGVAIGLLLPPRRDQMLVLPESLENPRIETDVTRGLETRELLLTLDAILPVLEHGFEADGREVDFGQGERTLVLFLDLPALVDELGRVETLRAVDRDDLRLADDDTSTVLEKYGEVLAGFARVIDDSLKDVAVQCVPLRVGSER